MWNSARAHHCRRRRLECAEPRACEGADSLPRCRQAAWWCLVCSGLPLSLNRRQRNLQARGIPALVPSLPSRSLTARWDYHQEAELGQGNFSRVYRAVHRLTGMAYAVKTNRSPIATLQARNTWLNVSSRVEGKGYGKGALPGAASLCRRWGAGALWRGV